VSGAGGPHAAATPEGFCQAAKPSVRTAVKLAIPRLILALAGHPRLGAKASQRKPDKLRRSLVLHLCSKAVPNRFQGRTSWQYKGRLDN